MWLTGNVTSRHLLKGSKWSVLGCEQHIVIKLYCDLNFFTVQLPMFLPRKPSQSAGKR